MILLIPALGLCAAWAGLTLLDDAPGPAGALLFTAALSALTAARLLTGHQTTPPRTGRASGAMRGLLRAARRPAPEAPTRPDTPVEPADSSWGRIDTPAPGRPGSDDNPWAQPAPPTQPAPPSTGGPWDQPSHPVWG